MSLFVGCVLSLEVVGIDRKDTSACVISSFLVPLGMGPVTGSRGSQA